MGSIARQPTLEKFRALPIAQLRPSCPNCLYGRILREAVSQSAVPQTRRAAASGRKCALTRFPHCGHLPPISRCQRGRAGQRRSAIEGCTSLGERHPIAGRKPLFDSLWVMTASCAGCCATWRGVHAGANESSKSNTPDSAPASVPLRPGSSPCGGRNPRPGRGRSWRRRSSGRPGG